MWFTLALLAGLLFAVNRLMIRSILTRGGSPIAFVAVHNLLAGILLLPVALFYFTPPSMLSHWLYLVLAAVMFCLADIFGFLSLKKIEASLFQIIAQLRHIVVLLGGYLFFAEPITGSKIIAIFLLVLGVGVAVIEKTGIKLTRGLVDAALASFFIGFAFLLIKLLTGHVSVPFLASFGFIFSGAMAYSILYIRQEIPKQWLPAKNPNQLILAAAIFAVFELVFFAALATGEVSKVTPVQQSAMVFSLIGGYLFLNEKRRLKQKIIGALLIAVGIGLLYFF